MSPEQFSKAIDSLADQHAGTITLTIPAAREIALRWERAERPRNVPMPLDEVERLQWRESFEALRAQRDEVMAMLAATWCYRIRQAFNNLWGAS